MGYDLYGINQSAEAAKAATLRWGDRNVTTEWEREVAGGEGYFRASMSTWAKLLDRCWELGMIADNALPYDDLPTNDDQVISAANVAVAVERAEEPVHPKTGRPNDAWGHVFETVEQFEQGGRSAVLSDSSADPLPDWYWTAWLRFLRGAVVHGGFQVS